jgi:hypothetical protein
MVFKKESETPQQRVRKRRIKRLDPVDRFDL